jgi:class 3 adenylate cyclase
VAAAQAMVVDALHGFNNWIRSQGLGDAFRMGIGINTGSVMSGNVGSERRLEYTAVADTTNTAARLEQMTKDAGHTVLVSDSTDPAWDVRRGSSCMSAGSSRGGDRHPSPSGHCRPPRVLPAEG